MCSIENLSVCTVYVRTHIPHIVSRFNITFQQIVSVIFQIVHVATVAAVQLA